MKDKKKPKNTPLTEAQQDEATLIFKNFKANILQHTVIINVYAQLIERTQKSDLPDWVADKIHERLEPYVEKLNEALNKIN